MESMNLLFYIICDKTKNIKNRYETNKSFFDIIKRFSFEEQDTDITIKDITDEI
jgi:hypothetical protein